MMKRTLLLSAFALLALGCAKKDYRDVSLPACERACILLSQMTLEEKVGQMCQYVGPCYVPPGQGTAHGNIDADDPNLGNPGMAEKVRRGEVGSFLHVLSIQEAVALQKLAQESRLKIPLLLGIDAVHGNALHTECTVYPTNISLASTFDTELAEKLARETAEEMRQAGMYWTFSPNLDVARDARWGRMGETFGEDPHLVSEMGKAVILGLQGRSGELKGQVLACAKHLIGGGEPAGGLNAAPMDMSERKMREIYLPPFVSAVREANVGTIMAAHNEINGIPCHGNKRLLKEILRDELGFKGFVVSDWMDIERMHSMHHWLPSEDEAFKVSVEAGIDMHMQGDRYFESIIDAVVSGRIPQKRIDEAVEKILCAKFALGLFEKPVPELVSEIENTAEHRISALHAAREGIVMLKNDGTLPLKRVRKIFVVGPNADSQTILGDWAAPRPAEDVVTVLKGIRAQFPSALIDTMCFGGKILDIRPSDFAKAQAKAAAADITIAVMGENSQRYSAYGITCGENNDRDNIDLPGLQEQLLKAICKAGKPIVLTLLAGRANNLVWASENVNAILEAWEPGMMGGQAVAEILAGVVNPSGKLPVTFPRNAGQIQSVYNHKHSQYSRKFALTPSGCLYPFGFGLSYTTFDYTEASLTASEISAGESLSASVKVTNTGSVVGDEIVQLYIRDEYGSVTRPVKELKAFKRISLAAGESRIVSFGITPSMLSCFGASDSWSVEPGDFTILLGSSSAESDLIPLPLLVK